MTEKKSLCDKRQKEKRYLNRVKRMSLKRRFNNDGIEIVSNKVSDTMHWDFNVGTNDHTKDNSNRTKSLNKRYWQTNKNKNNSLLS